MSTFTLVVYRDKVGHLVRIVPQGRPKEIKGMGEELEIIEECLVEKEELFQRYEELKMKYIK